MDFLAQKSHLKSIISILPQHLQTYHRFGCTTYYLRRRPPIRSDVSVATWKLQGPVGSCGKLNMSRSSMGLEYLTIHVP